MSYTPENNPYIPGDPYSYDLKWMVKDIKHMEERFGELDSQVQEATDQADRSRDEADRAFEEANRSRDEADRAFEEANRSRDEADRADDEALVSEGYAKGTQDGEAVTSGSPYYENNSKYFSEQSAASAQASAGSAAEAADYAEHIADPVSGLVADWLADHITQPTTPAIDTSLTVAGAAADAKAAGDYIRAGKFAYGIDPTNADENIINFLIDTLQYQADYYIANGNGNAVPASGLHLAVTPFIPVSGGDVIAGCLFDSSSQAQDHFGGVYDSNQNFIRSLYSIDPTPSGYEIKLPENAAYVRLTILTDVATNYFRFKRKSIDWLVSNDMSIKNVSQMKIAFLGDSITYGYGLTDIINERYTKLVENYFGANVINLGISGSEISTNDGVPDAMATRVADVPLDTDILFVFGGVNDYWHKNTPIGTWANNNTYLSGAVYNIIRYVKNYTSIRQLVFVIPFMSKLSGDYAYNSDFGYGTGLDFANAIKTICRDCAVDVIDLSTEGGITARANFDTLINRFTIDGLHPNADGHKWLANIMIHWIKAHYAIYKY